MKYWVMVAVLLLGFVSPQVVTKAIAEERVVAPDFSLETLSGEEISLSDFEGKVVLISFWATWCGPCLQELPHLDKMLEEFKDEGLVVLAINTDGSDTRSSVRRVVKRKKFKMPILMDLDGAVSATLNPRGVNPYTIVIDRKGRIAEEHEGYSPGDEEETEELVKALLDEGSGE